MNQLHSSKTWAAEREERRSCLVDWQNREAAAWHEQCLDLAQTDEQYTLLLDHKVGTPLGQLEAALSGFWSDSDNAALQVHNAMMRNKQQDPMPEGEWPHMTGSGKPLSTLANLKRLLSHYGIHPRYNLINKRDEAIVPGLTATRDNSDAATLAHVRSLAHMNRLPVNELGEYMLTVADENAYNPVLTWIESKPWDGVDRLEDLLDSVVIPADFDYTLRDTLITRWLVSAVAALAKPTGFHARGVLVFTGAQGIGKTSWFRNLLPASLSEYFREGAAIDPADKDSVTGAVSNWLVEIGELDATFRKADIARLKAFVTNGEDRIRKPYARTESMLPRRTVFCASVNDAQFLVDTTGNSRFWTVEVASLVYESITDDLQQLWAQVCQMFKDGEQWWLTPEEEAKLAASNSAFEQVDPLEEALDSRFNWAVSRITWMNSTEIMKSLGYDKPSKREANAVAALLKSRGVERRQRDKRFLMPDPIM